MLATETTILLYRMAGQNDEQALKQLFDEFYPRLLLFAQSFLKNRPVAEEVVEDVFIKLWQNRSSMPVIENFSAYLFRATKNNILNYQKQTKNQALLDITDVVIDLTATVKTPEELFISAETIHKVNAAIDLLPPKCRLVFRLVKEDGLKYKEVAELLNISIKTVENQMSHALKAVSEALALQKANTLHHHTKK